MDIHEVSDSHALVRPAVHAAFKVQRQALDDLRNGKARNPYLLRVLAENRYQPYARMVSNQVTKLNAAQQRAFDRANTLPDVLLVQGPPGTGKTHTITEVVRAHSQRHEQTLVTAKTHKAVDNVLQNLPRELEILRVGDPDKVANKALLIDERAKALQQSILQATESYSQELLVGKHIDELDRKVARMPDYSSALQAVEKLMNQAITERDQQHLAIKNYFAQEAQRRYQLWLTAAQDLEQQQHLIARLQKRHARAEQRQHWKLIGFFWRHRLPALQTRLSQTHYDLSQKQTSHANARAAYDHVQAEQEAAYQENSYRQLESEVEEQLLRLQRLETNIHAELQFFAHLLPKHFPSTQLLRLGNTARQIQDYLAWLQSAWTGHFRPTLLARYEIMSDWRQELETRTEDLYPLLLRMADVIGATCIGSATARILAEIDYDLIVVDEAGQISVSDLLVPLVRGQRTMLVGDHQQLPPIVDKDVEQRLQALVRAEDDEANEIDDEGDSGESQLTDLLKKSVFEMLVEQVDAEHFVGLTQQHRMPASIAAFVSEHFYAGRLETAGRHAGKGSSYHDPLFRKPFVFIDSTEMQPQWRKESKSGSQSAEVDGSRSYINEGEAGLVVDIVQVYVRRGLEWVVIVPYKGQARFIREKLQERLGKEYDLDFNACVSTVDTFQGGEKDIVLYSFTRSNKYHTIGFLKERRRLNVALTRAKEQLVLIGDSETLTMTNDEAFRALALAMLQHARTHGELLSFRTCRSRISQGGRM